MNSINVIGRLTKDPELRKLDEGRSLCTFTLAVDDVYSKDDRTDFLRVSAFGGLGDLCERYLRKGFWAGVTGKIRTDTYTDAEGVVRYPVKVIAENVRFMQWPERADEEGAQQAPPEKRRLAKSS
ncbi:MAG: single-stranded DNA-binding protein [Clostridiales Family XIII bacterium]|jgi:single-strand DNA-binding protein|nr:single-stranded DNA-binding protein [Clostridiales Family XIII bacterium]